MAEFNKDAGAPIRLRFSPRPVGVDFTDPVLWSLSDESKATMAPEGAEVTVTPVQGASGVVTITARSGIASDTATITWRLVLTGGVIEEVSDATQPQPTPTEPAPTPTEPTPTPEQPAPTPEQPAPVEPTPTPVEPSPEQPAPVEPTPTPEQPAPVEPTPTPAEPVPAEPTPAPNA